MNFFGRLEENWKKWGEQWEKYPRSKGYRYMRGVEKRIGEESSEDERRRVREEVGREEKGEDGSWFQISERCRMPYYVAMSIWRWLKAEEREGGGKSSLDRFECVMERCLEELEDRVSTKGKREKLTQVELKEILKTCRENMSTLSAIGAGQEDTIEIVTRMPMEEEEEPKEGKPN